MYVELIVAHSGGNFLPKRVLFLRAFFFRFKSKLSFRGKEKNPNGGGGFMNPQPITGNKVVDK